MARSPNVREKAACQGLGITWRNKSKALTRHARASRITHAKPKRNPPTSKDA
jgi:hypothetical protein